MKKHINIHIAGQVKKMDFIFYSQLFIQKLDLNGFIQNGGETNVYVEVEGEDESLQKLIDFYKDGLLADLIDDIQVENGEMLDYNKFTVKRIKLPSNKKKGFFSRFRKKSK